jgi:hypothetical protein
MNQTIILPVVNTIEENCIIQDGIKYCENQPLSLPIIGWSLLGTVAMIAYLFLLLWLDDEFDKSPIFFLSGILAPIIITGVTLILLG